MSTKILLDCQGDDPVKKYFNLPKGYDLERGKKITDSLNELLNSAGVSFWIAKSNTGQKRLNISVNEKQLEALTALKASLGRPQEYEIDYDLVQQMRQSGKSNREIYTELGISRSLFYLRMKEYRNKKEGKQMEKSYIEEQYKLAISDFNVARNEDEQWEARKTMARLEQIAEQAYGANYADQLAQLKKSIMQ